MSKYNMSKIINIAQDEARKKIAEVIQQGGIIAYPTESVFGLGCDPLHEKAVKKILAIKKRQIDKGLILIASEWKDVCHYILPIEPSKLTSVMSTWPGPVTWAFPASNLVPAWICGDKNTVALRITDHPIARQICQLLKMAIVSTSANRSGEEPARSVLAVQEMFEQEIDLIIEGEVGSLGQPTPIRDVFTGQYLRNL